MESNKNHNTLGYRRGVVVRPMVSLLLAFVLVVMAGGIFAFTAMAGTPTRATWASAANVVCGRWNAEQKRELPKAMPATDAGKVAAIQTLIKTNLAAFAQLKSIPAPASDHRLIATYLRAGAEIDSQFRAEMSALGAHDLAAFGQDAGRAGRLNQRANQMLRTLGATVCIG